MKLEVVAVRGSRTAWADDACDEYARRIRRHLPFEEIVLRPGRSGDDAARLLARVGPRARLVALDERGEDLGSEAFAGLVDLAAREGAASLVFALGGAWGHDAGVRERSWRVVRLSRMVMNHAVARVVLFEQLYRATAIRAGEPYHHG